MDNGATIARGYSPMPLIGQFYNLTSDDDLPVVFIISEHVDETCLAALRDLNGSGEEIAIIVLFASDNPEEEAIALEAGADDCIRIDLNCRSFHARLRATMARLQRLSSRARSRPAIRVNSLTHDAEVDGQKVSLTPLEFRLLEELQRQRGKVVAHAVLEEKLWREEGTASRQSLKQLVHRLRSRLGDGSDGIHSIAGVGYLLR